MVTATLNQTVEINLLDVTKQLDLSEIADLLSTAAHVLDSTLASSKFSCSDRVAAAKEF